MWVSRGLYISHLHRGLYTSFTWLVRRPCEAINASWQSLPTSRARSCSPNPAQAILQFPVTHLTSILSADSFSAAKLFPLPGSEPSALSISFSACACHSTLHQAARSQRAFCFSSEKAIGSFLRSLNLQNRRFTSLYVLSFVIARKGSLLDWGCRLAVRQLTGLDDAIL